jgi:hypothetical protein
MADKNRNFYVKSIIVLAMLCAQASAAQTSGQLKPDSLEIKSHLVQYSGSDAKTVILFNDEISPDVLITLTESSDLGCGTSRIVLPNSEDSKTELILAKDLASGDWHALMLALRHHIAALRPERIYLSIGALTEATEYPNELQACGSPSPLHGRLWVVMQTVGPDNQGSAMAFVVKNRNGVGHSRIRQHQIIYLEDLTGMNLLSDRTAETQEYMRAKMVPLKRANGGALFAAGADR